MWLLHGSLSDRDTLHHTNHLALPSLQRCNQYCSSNIVTTITDLRDSMWEDLWTVIRLIAVCFGNVRALHSQTLITHSLIHNNL